jgi:hypothetical protein
MMTKLKYTDKFNEGQRIKAYDFPPMNGRQDSYIEGVITFEDYSFNAEENAPDYCTGRLDFLAYKILIENDSGKTTGGRVGHIGYIPHETLYTEFEGRVELVETEI